MKNWTILRRTEYDEGCVGECATGWKQAFFSTVTVGSPQPHPLTPSLPSPTPLWLSATFVQFQDVTEQTQSGEIIQQYSCYYACYCILLKYPSKQNAEDSFTSALYYFQPSSCNWSTMLFQQGQLNVYSFIINKLIEFTLFFSLKN